MGQLAADLIKTGRGTEGSRCKRRNVSVCLEERSGTAVLLGRDQTIGQLIAQVFLEDVTLIDDHPDDEDQHDCITQIIYKGPRQQAFKAADQSAEGVMERV